MAQQFACGGAISANRLVKLNSSRQIEHCGASDANCIGATVGPPAPDTTEIGGVATGAQPFATGPIVVRKVEEFYLDVVVAAGDSLAAGGIAYQAADGKVASSGTVRVGVVMTGAAAGAVAQIMAC